MSYSTFPTIKHETDAVRRAQGAVPPGPLTFDAFRAANVARCLKWHPQGIESWSPSDWLTAVTGELGELASLLKMRNRERDSLPGNKFSPTQKQIADELADVATYLDLLAEVLGVDLGRAVAEKFNEVSERVGFPDRIPVPAGVSAPDMGNPISTQPAPGGWQEAERISNVPAVDEAIRALLDDQTGDNATGLVRTVLDAYGVSASTHQDKPPADAEGMSGDRHE